MKDKRYRPERDGAKNAAAQMGRRGDLQADGTILNTVNPGATTKPLPPTPMNKPVPVGGKPTGSTTKPLPVRPSVMNKPVPVGGKPTMPVVRPAKPGDRPSLPTLTPSQGQATMEALKRKQDEMAKAAAMKKKKSGK
jgi:hypothetical protein